MSGSKRRLTFIASVEQRRPDLSWESLGVGVDLPGVTPNPLLSGEARTRSVELRRGVLS